MKQFSTLVLLLVVFGVNQAATANSGERYGECKLQVKRVFGPQTRVKLIRITGAKVKVRVTPKDERSRYLLCERSKEQGLQLFERNGMLVQKPGSEQ